MKITTTKAHPRGRGRGTTITLDFRTRSHSGTSVVCYEQDGLSISRGVWTVVRWGHLARFEFDHDVPWKDQLGLDGKSSHELRAEVITAAMARFSEGHLLKILHELVQIYESGVSRGRADMAADLRALIGLVR